ncbi:AFC2 [Symbiodinium necroappetens]|uniref:AFC2 protein n=1 Tax=Symbiodinium necroappetens TaxID=1628268 RepID=A0A812M5U4_9DINO|nr:AFC2 [Symbiodinium necroappetens]
MEQGGSCSRWSPNVPEGDGQGACTPSHRHTADSSNEGESDRDAIVHFHWEPGQLLNRRYRLHSLAGEGTFGRVCLATDTTKKTQVAIKIIRDVTQFREAAQEEAAILATICAADPWGQFRCCRMHTSFLHDSRFFCMVLEPLGCSLYESIKANDYRGFWLQDIQIIAKQLLYALNFLHTKMRYTHTDLKPENIMLTSMEPARPEWFPREEFCEGDGVLRKKKRSRHQYLRPRSAGIKIIDFGNTIREHDRRETIINTRQYRGPEVILELGWDEKSDLWSAGCILMELYTGEMLFGTHENMEHLALVEEILAPLYRSRQALKPT